MNIQQFEDLIRANIKTVVLDIIRNNPSLNISAKSRAGAEISDYLEDEFTKTVNGNSFFIETEKAPKGATKNPWDVKTVIQHNAIMEKIWIDFKALKITGADSNPDVGTPNKIVKFIKDGNFYLVFVYVYYEETRNGLRFVEIENDFVKIFFLKDIHHSFRRNPKNQLQVNISEPPEYRTRAEFIKLLFKKIKESHERQMKISQKALLTLENDETALLKENRKTEAMISEKL